MPSRSPKTRRIKVPEYKSFKISKSIKRTDKKIIGSGRLLMKSISTVLKNWKLFGGLVVVYLLLTLILVKGFGLSSQLAELKNSIQDLTSGQSSQIITSLTLFGVLLGNSNATSSDVASTYQSFILVLMSLVIIWSLRHSLAGKKQKLGVKDAFYKGIYPLIPFLIVLIIIGLQLIPIVSASVIFGLVITGGLAVTLIEQVLWILLLILLALLSIYMVTSSVFALYIVTLPDVKPMQAIRSASELVKNRRWIIMRKVMILPLALLILAAIIIVPIIMVSPVVAEGMFFVISMGGLVLVHSYYYHLYRELL